MFEKVLVPIDFTEESDRVLVYVMGMKVFGVKEIVLTHVVNIGTSTGWPMSPKIIESIKEKLNKRQLKVEKAGFKSRTQILEGAPASELLRVAQEEKFSLIVTGSQGKAPLEELFFGSVSETVTRRANVPVLVLRNDILKNVEGARSLITYASRTFSKVLFPSDFGDSSASALDELEKLKKVGVGEVVALHVIDDDSAKAKEDRDQAKACYADCKRIAGKLESRGIKASTLCRTGDPGKEILEVADEVEATVIMMGSHGKGVVREWLDGSVSLEVLRHANQPIIIVHPAA